MNGKFLMIQNLGVAPVGAFTLMGASTKSNHDLESNIIGFFGSGSKMASGVLLRHNISPIIFAGNLKLTFGTRKEYMGNKEFDRVIVKYSGKDEDQKTRNSTEDLGFVLDYGSRDWSDPSLALREYVSNAIDQQVEEGEKKFKSDYFKLSNVENEHNFDPEQYKMYIESLRAYRLVGVREDYKNVIVEVVEGNQVRAKSGHTRVFVPLTKTVQDFYNNLGKWFLHFSEPENIHKEILPKNNRNIDNSKCAVIYRRGVRVREIQYTKIASLFDYNFREIPLDEARKVDDWQVKNYAGQALARSKRNTISAFWQSFFNQTKVWEHEFSQYSLSMPGNLTATERENIKKTWVETFESVVGSDAIISTQNGGELALRKGYKVINVSDEIYAAAKELGIKTPDQVLTQDEREGRVITDPTLDAICAVDFIWTLMRQHNLLNGKEYPKVKGFKKAMDGGSQLLGYYRDNTVFINNELGNDASKGGNWKVLSHQLLQTALEEVVHHTTGAHDFTRDMQDMCLNLVICIAKSYC